MGQLPGKDLLVANSKACNSEILNITFVVDEITKDGNTTGR